MSVGAPAGPRAFDRWVAKALLGPGSAMFREGNILLRAEVTDPTPYHSVLSAIADGAHRRSEIAAILRRPDSALSHPLAVLEHVQLVNRVPDALQPRRSVYHVAEPGCGASCMRRRQQWAVGPTMFAPRRSPAENTGRGTRSTSWCRPRQRSNRNACWRSAR
jgi:DNA-binding HxlR family transcriptional regulator